MFFPKNVNPVHYMQYKCNKVEMWGNLSLPWSKLVTHRAVARTLIGGGVYSYIQVLPD